MGLRGCWLTLDSPPQGTSCLDSDLEMQKSVLCSLVLQEQRVIGSVLTVYYLISFKELLYVFAVLLEFVKVIFFFFYCPWCWRLPHSILEDSFHLRLGTLLRRLPLGSLSENSLGVSPILLFRRCVLWELSIVLFPGILGVSSHGHSHLVISPHRQCWLSARCHCSDRECIHNIFLLFARQKMVLVIASCRLAPLQSRSKWVLFSFRSCESDAFPPCFGITAKHMHWNPSWSSVCQMIILLQRVCPGPLYLFFFFVTLVYVHCDGDRGIDVGRRHNCIKARLATWGVVNDDKLLRGKAFAGCPWRQPCATWAVVQQMNLGPSPVVPRVFSTVYSLFHLFLYFVWIAL